MREANGFALIALVLSSSGNAQTAADFEFVPRIDFVCAGTEVSFVVEGARELFGAEQIVEAFIAATRGNVSVSFKTWSGIDYIGGSCIEDTEGRPHIVYQAYCGGSGCADLSNWGIIDAVELREELIPEDGNTDRAQEILGKNPPRILRLISLYRVSQTLGNER